MKIEATHEEIEALRNSLESEYLFQEAKRNEVKKILDDKIEEHNEKHGKPQVIIIDYRLYYNVFGFETEYKNIMLLATFKKDAIEVY